MIFNIWNFFNKFRLQFIDIYVTICPEQKGQVMPELHMKVRLDNERSANYGKQKCVFL